MWSWGVWRQWGAGGSEGNLQLPGPPSPHSYPEAPPYLIGVFHPGDPAVQARLLPVIFFCCHHQGGRDGIPASAQAPEWGDPPGPLKLYPFVLQDPGGGIQGLPCANLELYPQTTPHHLLGATSPPLPCPLPMHGLSPSKLHGGLCLDCHRKQQSLTVWILAVLAGGEKGRRRN